MFSGHQIVHTAAVDQLAVEAGSQMPRRLCESAVRDNGAFLAFPVVHASVHLLYGAVSDRVGVALYLDRNSSASPGDNQVDTLVAAGLCYFNLISQLLEYALQKPFEFLVSHRGPARRSNGFVNRPVVGIQLPPT